MKRLLGRLLCAWTGHTRGKRDKARSTQTEKVYFCERCGASWSRKVNGKAKSAA